jgi:uncharacterized protein (TIGR00725 family)
LRTIVSVIGPSQPTKEQRELALQIGALIAKENWVLISGGKGGVMEAASKGAKEAGGLVVGILPESDTSGANPYLDIAIPTGLGEARNFLVVRPADVVVALGLSAGTLIEIHIAKALNKPLIGLGLPEDNPFGIETFDRPEDVLDGLKHIISK